MQNSAAEAALPEATGDWKRTEFVVTVKAYPSASTKYRETVCVAGIRPGIMGTGELVRLYPVPFRSMPFNDRFKKWDRISIPVHRHPSDTRPESFRPNVDAIEWIEHLDTGNRWAPRRTYMDQVSVHSMCELRALQAETKKSLGVVDPGEVLDMVITPRDEADRAESLQRIRNEPSLFDDDNFDGVEVPPYYFRYHFRCADCVPGGNPHKMSNIDWEIMQAYRRWRSSYGEPGALEHIRTKWMDEICAPTKETLFFAGNMHQHPGSFLVLGCWWPPTR